MTIEWDPAKNRSNARKHGITFDDARAVFEDPHRVDGYDDHDYGENRWSVVGRVGSVLVYVVYADREGGIRLISARKAAPIEQERYVARNAGR